MVEKTAEQQPGHNPELLLRLEFEGKDGGLNHLDIYKVKYRSQTIFVRQLHGSISFKLHPIQSEEFLITSESAKFLITWQNNMATDSEPLPI